MADRARKPQRDETVMEPKEWAIAKCSRCRAFSLQLISVNLLLSMRRQAIPVLLSLFAFGSCLAGPNRAQGQSISNAPTVVLESFNIVHEIVDTMRTSLFIRVWSDKKVEYQKSSEDYAVVTASVSDDQLSSLHQRLDAIDMRKIKDQMGPFNVYEHSVLEVLISLSSRGSRFNFKVINPWPEGVPGRSLKKGKLLPKEVKAIICECSRIRSLVSQESIDPNCDSGHVPAKKSN
jgi:hypothetical protein